MSTSQMAVHLGITYDKCRHIRRKFGLIIGGVTTEQFKKNKEKTSERSNFKKIQEELIEKEETLEEAFKIKKTPQLLEIKDVDETPAEAVAFLIASDWHIEEEVLASHGLNNEYNLQISEERAKNFFANGAYMVKLAQKHSTVNKLILPLLGDFITNSLRDENLENNLLQPGDALWQVKNYLVSGIKYLLKTLPEIEIVAVCHTGNHGRMTEKVHIATEGGNSLEKYMYRNLAEYFENEPRIKFMIADGQHTYVKVFDKTVRFLHGHSIKFGGGVGGITIPVRKAISQWNKMKWADLTIMGHFHQMIVMEDFIVNGSLIGYNAFAQFIKADYEEPRQVFFVIHKHAGGTKTLISPVWLDKKQ